MNFHFWDGVLISSIFWFYVCVACLFRGLWVGSQIDYAPLSEGFEAGWNAAQKNIHIIEKSETFLKETEP